MPSDFISLFSGDLDLTSPRSLYSRDNGDHVRSARSAGRPRMRQKHQIQLQMFIMSLWFWPQGSTVISESLVFVSVLCLSHCGLSRLSSSC
ncbi:nuclear factor of activated T-cells 5-like isoform X2 [Lates japonicus]